MNLIKTPRMIITANHRTEQGLSSAARSGIFT